MHETPMPRSLLFVPGHRESMVAKAAGIGADAIVFDLEDSVPPGDKDAARDQVAHRLADWPEAAPKPFVRVNPPRAGLVDADCAVLRDVPGVGVLVPKVDLPIELNMVFDALGGRDRTLLVNIETPRSLLRAEDLADTPGVDGLFLGGEDLTWALGTKRTPRGDELAWPRMLVLLAARAAGIAAYDTVCPEFRDLDILAHDCRVGADMGYDGKFAIHPAQLPVIHEAYTPSAEETERARRIVNAYDEALQRGLAAVAVDGQMVDPPVAERARAIVQRAERYR